MWRAACGHSVGATTAKGGIVSKIIVGVDDSERSKDAVALAARLAGPSDAELVLVRVFPFDDVPGRGAATAAYEQYLREEALAALGRAADGLPETIRSRTHAVPNLSPARGIQELAAREIASLIVIGSSHRGAFGRVMAGTTAERLLHGAPCPVAVAPLGYHQAVEDGIASIAVGYDASPEAEAALSGALVLARSLGARLKLIDVIDVMWFATPALMSGPGYYLDPEDLEERARTRLAKKVASLPADVAVEVQVLTGSPASELAERSNEADLLVVGSRGYGPHRAVLLGSVSGTLVRSAACPVLVVPRGIATPLEDLFPATSTTGTA
jgi:nucleotide-binding universal stress UspA family protein